MGGHCNGARAVWSGHLLFTLSRSRSSHHPLLLCHLACQPDPHLHKPEPQPWGSRRLLTDGNGAVCAFPSASSTSSESWWTDRFARVWVSPGDMALRVWRSQPPWYSVWPWGWPHGHRKQEVLGITYLKLITISMSSSKELPNPLNPSCWKHTFQTESIFLSILLKQSWLVFSSPQRNLQSYCSVNLQTVQCCTAPLHFTLFIRHLMVPLLPTLE